MIAKHLLKVSGLKPGENLLGPLRLMSKGGCKKEDPCKKKEDPCEKKEKKDPCGDKEENNKKDECNKSTR